MSYYVINHWFIKIFSETFLSKIGFGKNYKIIIVIFSRFLDFLSLDKCRTKTNLYISSINFNN